MEQHWLDADVTADGRFLLDHCAEDFVHMGDEGFSSRQELLEIYAQETGQPERRSQAHDVVVRRLGDAAAVIAYKVMSTMGDETQSWYASTAYHRTPDGWRAVLRHETWSC
ncbi:nuclear transport factor 2 family protein [Nonomuraea sp. NPDC026600]|uniref:nuclear transport factor 2 family protein n=1 Tax=Nonomuraea sp. NPDC026600 TaxID=3155363 RepID=UPI003402EB3F